MVNWEKSRLEPSQQVQFIGAHLDATLAMNMSVTLAEALQAKGGPLEEEEEINRRLKRRDVEEVSMASDSASKNIDILMFETLITDALERLSDKVATMIDPINLQLQEINHKLEAIAEETRKAKEMAQHRGNCWYGTGCLTTTRRNFQASR
ncbi:UNVERIFIED_CONTAM: hypothetical protein K2H54_011785 [Gekko kuhli]